MLPIKLSLVFWWSSFNFTTRPRLQRGWATYAFTTHQTLSFFHALATRPRLQRGWAIYAFATHQTLSFFMPPLVHHYPPLVPQLVLVCNEDGQHKRLQRIKHFPFFMRLFAKTKLLSTTSNSMISRHSSSFATRMANICVCNASNTFLFLCAL